MKKSIAIIGGSIAGLSAALFFASAKNEELDFDITVFDEGKADLKAAAIYNVPFFPKGAKADEIYTHIKAQIASMLEVKYIDSKVVSISGEKGDFTVNDEQGLGIKADYTKQILLQTSRETDYQRRNLRSRTCFRCYDYGSLRDGKCQ